MERQSYKQLLCNKVISLAGIFDENKHPRKAGRFAKSSSTSTKKSKAPTRGAFAVPEGTNTDNTAGETVPVGLVTPGNLNLHQRPVVNNPDGSISTVRSISIGTDAGTVLIPTVVGDKVVSDKAAIDHYLKTGEHLGVFKDDQSAEKYAQVLHKAQDKEYAKKTPKLTKAQEIEQHNKNVDTQSKANSMGSKLKKDGILGPKTKDAVKAAQLKLNKEGAKLKVDGIWGPKTEAAFKKHSGSKGKEVAKPHEPSSKTTSESSKDKETIKVRGPMRKIVN